MTREEAKRQAARRWGKRSYWQVGTEQSSPERRSEVQAIADGARAERAALEAELKRREEEAGIPALRGQIKAAGERFREAALGGAVYYRFRVGFTDSIIGAFNVCGEGDTWEEAFAAADTNKTIGASRLRSA